MAAPTLMTYDYTYAKFVVGDAVSLTPNYSGGTATSFTISATLPNGLYISPTTGVISGTVSSDGQVYTPTKYTITASNTDGSTTAEITIQIFSAGMVMDIFFPVESIHTALGSSYNQFLKISPIIEVAGGGTSTSTINWETSGEYSGLYVSNDGTLSTSGDASGIHTIIATSSDAAGLSTSYKVYVNADNVIPEPTFSAYPDGPYHTVPCYAITPNGSVSVIKKVTEIVKTQFVAEASEYTIESGFTADGYKHTVKFSDATTGIVLDSNMFSTYAAARTAWLAKYTPSVTEPSY